MTRELQLSATHSNKHKRMKQEQNTRCVFAAFLYIFFNNKESLKVTDYEKFILPKFSHNNMSLACQ